MGWIIRYARVGNAEPIYTVQRSDDHLTALASSVKGVADITGMAVRRVRPACEEAREEGVSHYLD